MLTAVAALIGIIVGAGAAAVGLLALSQSRLRTAEAAPKGASPTEIYGESSAPRTIAT